MSILENILEGNIDRYGDEPDFDALAAQWDDEQDETDPFDDEESLDDYLDRVGDTF